MQSQTLSSGARNVGDAERLISALGGGALAIYGLARRSPRGLGLAALGGALVARGVTGHCQLYEALGKSGTEEAADAVPAGERKALASVTIDRPKDEVYACWRRFENHALFMPGIWYVETRDDGRTRWIAEAPGGGTLQWEAQVVHELPYDLIGWRTLDGAPLPHAGSVHFTMAPGGGTVVRAALRYDRPPEDLCGLLGADPGDVLQRGLDRFKALVESGAFSRVGEPALA